MVSLADSPGLPFGRRLPPNRTADAALSEALGELDTSPEERVVTLDRRWAPYQHEFVPDALGVLVPKSAAVTC